MEMANAIAADELTYAGRPLELDRASTQASASAVSWGAILAGAAAAAALSLILLMLGVGLGLSSVSPWASDGVSAATFGVSTILWISFTQLVASGMGGYLAGRLRTKWVSVHTDEAYFRDTAHGFLAWAVASLVTAALLTSVIGSIVGGGVRASASALGGAATTTAAAAAGGAGGVTSASSNGDGRNVAMGYFIDSLFRRDSNVPAGSALSTSTDVEPANASGQANGATSAEVAGIFLNGIRAGALPAEDVRYVGQAIAQHTGLSQVDAEKRLTNTFARAQAKLRDAEQATKEAADAARRASSYAALWLFISLLVGAFFASLAATLGGRRRDL